MRFHIFGKTSLLFLTFMTDMDVSTKSEIFTACVCSYGYIREEN